MSYTIEYTTEDEVGLSRATWNVAKLGVPCKEEIKKHVDLLNDAYFRSPDLVVSQIKVVGARILQSHDNKERARYVDQNWLARKKCEVRAQEIKDQEARKKEKVS